MQFTFLERTRRSLEIGYIGADAHGAAVGHSQLTRKKPFSGFVFTLKRATLTKYLEPVLDIDFRIFIGHGHSLAGYL